MNAKSALLWSYGFKIFVVTIGAGITYLGYDLFIRGVTGQASLSVESGTVKGQLINAAPGLFFALCGVVVIITTVYKGARRGQANVHSQTKSK